MCLLCVAAGAAAQGAAGYSPAASSAAAATGKNGFIVAHFVNPVLVSVFGLKFYSYGVFVALAVYLAFLLFGSELLRARIKLDEMVCFFVFLAGFGGGSKAHVVLSPILAGGSKLSMHTFWEFIDLRTGHSFLGSMIGCVIALLTYVKWNRVRILPFLDVLLPCCLVGHAIGKIGCFMSGDGCYGPPADPHQVPWAMSFPNGQVPVEVPVHPTPLYEMTASALVCIIVRATFPFPAAPAEGEENKKVTGYFPRAGRRTSLLLMLHGIERVLLEKFRRHPSIEQFGGLSEYQAIAVMLVLSGCLIELAGRLFHGSGEDSRSNDSASADASTHKKEKEKKKNK